MHIITRSTSQTTLLDKYYTDCSNLTAKRIITKIEKERMRISTTAILVQVTTLCVVDSIHATTANKASNNVRLSRKRESDVSSSLLHKNNEDRVLPEMELSVEEKEFLRYLNDNALFASQSMPMDPPSPSPSAAPSSIPTASPVKIQQNPALTSSSSRVTVNWILSGLLIVAGGLSLELI